MRDSAWWVAVKPESGGLLAREPALQILTGLGRAVVGTAGVMIGDRYPESTVKERPGGRPPRSSSLGTPVIRQVVYRDPISTDPGTVAM